MKQVSAIFIFGVSFLFVGIASAADSPLKIATYSDFPPFITDAMPGGGIINEIVTASFQAVDIDIDIQFIPWKRSYRAVARGEVLASHSWAYSEERAKDFYFSAPLFMVSNQLLTTLPELENWTVLTHEQDKAIILCTPIGWKIAEELEVLVDQGTITLMAPSRPRSCMELMRAERTDLIYMPQITAAYHLNAIIAEEINHPVRPCPKIRSVNTPSGSNNTQHVIFTKNDAGAAYKTQFDTGFQKIVADGTYKAILTRFLATLSEIESANILQDQINAGIMPDDH